MKSIEIFYFKISKIVMKACKRLVIPCYTRDKEGERNEVAIQKMDSMP